MWRGFLVLILACVLSGYAGASQGPEQPAKERPDELKRERQSKPTKGAPEAVPAEEDTTLAPQEYSFNPLQAQKEVSTGKYYFKKHNYHAAALRFREATKWNDGFAEAWLLLGEASEKSKDRQAAREAYTKYLEVAADAKDVGEIRKKIDKLK